MQEKAIDFEKDYLVIYKDVRGKFHSFRWFPSENLSPEEITKKIFVWNQRKERIDDELQSELITDQLVREICAYKKKSEPLDDLVREMNEMQKGIEETKKFLESALDDLNRIGVTE